jgi:leucyl aminopeptidase
MDKIFPGSNVKLISSNSLSGNLQVSFTQPDDKTWPRLPEKAVGSVLPVTIGDITHILVSLGDKSKFTNQTYSQAAASLVRWCIRNGITDISFDLDQNSIGNETRPVRSILEGFTTGGFDFDHYKTRIKSQKKILNITLVQKIGTTIDNELIRAVIVGESMDLAREWIQEPANIINPQSLEDRVSSLAKTYGLSINVIQYEELIKMGAGGITAVGKGSQIKPRIIILQYQGGGNKKPISLVGKAITFDTGGYSLKGVDFIKGMKYDKSGGISVIATILAASRLKLKANIVAVIPTAENMISGDAYRPDDILHLLSGHTVEITTTDAEGRLILADAITYTQSTHDPSVIIDIATLTGGVKIALGTVRAGLLSNSDKLSDTMFKLGEEIGEKIWRLPMDNEYFDIIKSDVADMKNAGGKEASTIVGGIFLKQVITSGVDWAHMDIAATAETEHKQNWCPKGPTGFGIKLMLETIEALTNKSEL